MQFLDFFIQIETRHSDGGYQVRVIAPAGEGSGIFRLPSEVLDFSNALPATDKEYSGRCECRHLRSLGLHAAIDPEMIGGSLFDSLFTGEIGVLFQRSLGRTESDFEVGLRLHFGHNPEQSELESLESIPWELLYWRQRREFLAVCRLVSIARALPVPRSPRSAVLSGKIRVLVVASQPRGLPELKLEEEIENLCEAIGRTQQAEVVVLRNISFKALRRMSKTTEFQVLHFLGHGAFETQTGEGALFFEGKAGKPRSILARDFAELLDELPGLRLVVLNACETACMGPSQDPFAGVASAIFMKGVPAVLAMRAPILDEAAVLFAECFYEQLACGDGVEAALTKARRALRTEGQDAPNHASLPLWAIPALFLRIQAGDAPQEHSPAQLRPLPSRSQRELKYLLARVDTVCDAYIETAEEVFPLVELRRSLELDLVQANPLETVDRWQVGRLTPDMSLGEVFEATDRRLLISGAAGSGKTMALIGLARELIKAHRSDDRAPVPVILTLTSWARYRDSESSRSSGPRGLLRRLFPRLRPFLPDDTSARDEEPSLEGWITRELKSIYAISRDVRRAWLRESRLVLLLDGLDEVRPEAREDCLKQINEFEAGPSGIVVSCRLEKLKELHQRLKLNAAIHLLPLTPVQVNLAIRDMRPKPVVLIEQLAIDKSLEELARSPMMLGILAEVCRDAEDVADLEGTNVKTIEERRSHLFEIFIKRMFEKPGGPHGVYSDSKTLGWLSGLAKGMLEHDQSVFMIEELQPSWLPSRFRRFYNWVLRLVAAACITVMFLIAYWIIEPDLTSEISKESTMVALLAIGIAVGAMWIELRRLPGLVSRRKLIWSPDTQILFCQALCVLGITILTTSFFRESIDRLEISEAVSLGIISGMIFGVICNLVLGLPGSHGGLTQEIRTTETLTWSWRRSKNGAYYGFIRGLCVGVGVSVALILMIFCDLLGWDVPLIWHPIWILICCGSLLGFIFGGLRSSVQERASAPNQGMWLSMQNSIWIFLGSWILWGLMFCLINLAITLEWATIWGIGFLFGWITALHYGLVDGLKHLILRLLLWLSGAQPLHLAPFMEYAEHLGFMKQIDRGYIFRHRYLLEHFAQWRSEDYTP